MSWLLFCDMSKTLSSDHGPLKNIQKSSHFFRKNINKDPYQNVETPSPPYVCYLHLVFTFSKCAISSKISDISFRRIFGARLRPYQISMFK